MVSSLSCVLSDFLIFSTCARNFTKRLINFTSHCICIYAIVYIPALNFKVTAAPIKNKLCIAKILCRIFIPLKAKKKYNQISRLYCRQSILPGPIDIPRRYMVNVSMDTTHIFQKISKGDIQTIDSDLPPDISPNINTTSQALPSENDQLQQHAAEEIKKK